MEDVLHSRGSPHGLLSNKTGILSTKRVKRAAFGAVRNWRRRNLGKEKLTLAPVSKIGPFQQLLCLLPPDLILPDHVQALSSLDLSKPEGVISQKGLTPQFLIPSALWQCSFQMEDAISMASVSSLSTSAMLVGKGGIVCTQAFPFPMFSALLPSIIILFHFPVLQGGTRSATATPETRGSDYLYPYVGQPLLQFLRAYLYCRLSGRPQILCGRSFKLMKQIP